MNKNEQEAMRGISLLIDGLSKVVANKDAKVLTPSFVKSIDHEECISSQDLEVSEHIQLKETDLSPSGDLLEFPEANPGIEADVRWFLDLILRPYNKE